MLLLCTPLSSQSSQIHQSPSYQPPSSPVSGPHRGFTLLLVHKTSPQRLSSRDKTQFSCAVSSAVMNIILTSFVSPDWIHVTLVLRVITSSQWINATGMKGMFGLFGSTLVKILTRILLEAKSNCVCENLCVIVLAWLSTCMCTQHVLVTCLCLNLMTCWPAVI